MTSNEIRQKFLEFFKSKGHKIIPSASLIPENDPSVLFTTAGMQQFKPYYIGKKNAQKDFGTLNVASVQKCIRTSDIDEVGDESHLIFFEMLGNFSFGGYWKEDAVKYAYKFITSPDWMNLKIDYVSVFAGERNVPADLESEKIWKSIDSNIEVKKSGRADNFWGPTGEEGPCGPTTEIYVDGIEIWNIVFNEFYQNSDKTLKSLETKGVDTGMGLERLAKVVQKVPTVFDTDLFASLFDLIGGNVSEKNKRIIIDHMRAVSFMVCGGITPGNKSADYVLRRIIRRVIAIDPTLNVYTIIGKISEMFDSLDKNKIQSAFKEERDKFDKTLARGLIEMEKIKNIDTASAFKLYESYGLPFDVIKDKFPELNRKDFEKEFEKHQEISKAGMEQKFKGGLGGHSEMETKYHTATHLLLAALRKVLNKEVVQKGSNITTERLRFDFNWPEKLSAEQLKAVEDLVNEKIKENIPVEMVELPKEEAKKMVTTLSFDLSKYGDMVKVYKIGDFSVEFCGGPHVSRTGELASTNSAQVAKFKITKEEASSAGVRRIKAILE